VSYEEEDTCMSYEEEDTCISKGCQVEHVIESHLQSMSYEEDTCMSYVVADTFLLCVVEYT
jgi:hypothetical protein